MIDAKEAFVRRNRGKGVRDAALAGVGRLCVVWVLCPPALLMCVRSSA